MDFSLDLIRVTEAAAIAASSYIGGGDKNGADGAATEAMRDRLNRMPICGKIVIGEGKKDEAPGLFDGEWVGAYRGVGKYVNKKDSQWKKIYDIAVDPVDGTTQTAKGGPEASSVMAFSGPDTMYTTESHYVMKMCYGPRTKKYIDNKYGGDKYYQLDFPIGEVAAMVADALKKQVDEVTVCVLDRPRNGHSIELLREIGCRIKLIQDCDVNASIATCLPNSGIDLYCGIGGAPEAVISAAAVKCLGGGFEMEEVERLLHGSSRFVKCGEVLNENDLVRGPCAFISTGITDGSLLDGVQVRKGSKPLTHSLFMKSASGTYREIRTTHGN